MRWKRQAKISWVGFLGVLCSFACSTDPSGEDATDPSDGDSGSNDGKATDASGGDAGSNHEEATDASDGDSGSNDGEATDASGGDAGANDAGSDDQDGCAAYRELDDWRIDSSSTQEEVDSIAQCVETIAGALVVFESQLTSLELPRLTSVGRIEIRRNHLLEEVDIPILPSTGTLQMEWTGSGLIEISRNPALTSVTLDELACLPTGACDDVERVAGLDGLRLVDNNALNTLELPALEAAADLYFSGGKSFASFSAPKLRTIIGSMESEAGDTFVWGLQFSICPALEQVELPQLEEVRFGAVHLYDSDAITTLELAALQSAAAFSFRGNDELTSLSLPSLVDLTYMEFVDNPKFSMCDISALESQLDVTCAPLDSFSGPECSGNLDEACE